MPNVILCTRIMWRVYVVYCSFPIWNYNLSFELMILQTRVLSWGHPVDHKCPVSTYQPGSMSRTTFLRNKTSMDFISSHLNFNDAMATNLVHGTTTVQNPSDQTGQIELQWYEMSIEVDLRVKSHQWNGPQWPLLLPFIKNGSPVPE